MRILVDQDQAAAGRVVRILEIEQHVAVGVEVHAAPADVVGGPPGQDVRRVAGKGVGEAQPPAVQLAAVRGDEDGARTVLEVPGHEGQAVIGGGAVPAGDAALLAPAREAGTLGRELPQPQRGRRVLAAVQGVIGPILVLADHDAAEKDDDGDSKGEQPTFPGPHRDRFSPGRSDLGAPATGCGGGVR